MKDIYFFLNESFVTNKYIDIFDLKSFDVREDNKSLVLVDIEVKTSGKNNGVNAILELTNYADRVNKIVLLTPDPRRNPDGKKISKVKLIQYYKNLGFIVNDNDKYHYEMIRYPKN